MHDLFLHYRAPLLQDFRLILEYISGHWTLSGVAATCAIFLTLREQATTRRHHRLSVKPFLMDKTNWENNGQVLEAVTFEIINNGLGPAFIKEYQILHNSKPLEYTGHHDLEKQICTIFPRAQVTQSYIFANEQSAIAAKEKKVVLKLEMSDENSTQRDVEKAFECITIKITYLSMYNETYTYHSGKVPPPPTILKGTGIPKKP